MTQTAPSTLEPPRDLADAMNRAGHTQITLSGATGISQSYISQIFQGKRNPSLETVGRISDALQLEPGVVYEFIVRAHQARTAPRKRTPRRNGGARRGGRKPTAP